MAASKDRTCWREKASKIALLQLEKCQMCEGFYGPNFGEAICKTCHLFLFPEVDLEKPNPHYGGANMNKEDSIDSGTEEPSDAREFYVVRNPVAVPGREAEGAMVPRPMAPIQHIGDDDNWCAELQVSLPVKPLPPCHKAPDELAERIQNLSVYKHADEHTNAELNPTDALPTEVLLKVFSYLDEVSLYSCSEVCVRWSCIIASDDRVWEPWVQRRWPLWKPRYAVESWRDVFGKLLNSSPCRKCIQRMKTNCNPSVHENSWRHRRLLSELRNLRSDPPEGIFAKPLDNKCSHWQAAIEGPRGSPYEGGIFFLYLQIPYNYPMYPPYVQFITRVYHPNVSCHGDIGIDSIQHNWSLALTLSKILLSIQSLLTDPFLRVCMEPALALQYVEDRQEFNKQAQLWTWKYAMTETIPPNVHYMD